jgi:hypothetical protein
MALLALTATFGRSDDHGEQLLVVVQAGKYGYIDHTGRVVIPPQFLWAEDFWRGLGTVYVCGRYASIDASGSITALRIAAPRQLAAQSEGQKVGFVDEHGRFRISPSFDDALMFQEGLAAVRIGDRWGFIDTSGKQVIPPRFSAAYYFREGVATAKLGDSYVLIDRSGRVLASGYEFTKGIVSQGRVPVAKGNKNGYLDLQGRVVIPLIYDSVDSFSGGLAAVMKSGKWGYIDSDGRMVIPFRFDEAGPFGSGLAPVRIGGRTGFINKSGGIAFELAFRHAPGFLAGDEKSDLFIADADVSRFFTTDEKFGYVNTSGKVIWGPTDGTPDHPPLWGWSDKEKVESCEGIPPSVRSAVARLP